jgi:hypothetical protein
MTATQFAPHHIGAVDQPDGVIFGGTDRNGYLANANPSAGINFQKIAGGGPEGTRRSAGQSLSRHHSAKDGYPLKISNGSIWSTLRTPM